METILTTGSCGMRWAQCRIIWEQFDVNIDNNTSKLRITSIEFRSDSDSGMIADSNGINVSVDGQKLLYISPGSVYLANGYYIDTSWDPFKYKSGGAVVTAESGTILHEDDGSKAINISVNGGFSFANNLGIWQYCDSFAASGTIDMPSVPRGSKIRSGWGKVTASGTHVAFSFEQYLNDVTHTLVLEHNGMNYTMFSNRAELTSSGMSLTGQLYGSDVSACSFTVDAVLKTYRNGELFGTDRKSIEFVIAEDVVPNIRYVLVSDTEKLQNKYGKYVQNASRPLIKTSVSMAAMATITDRRIFFDGEEYSGTSVQAKTLTSSGTVTGKLVVTDCRGRTAEQSFSIDAYVYTPPVLTGCKAYRCSQDGTQDEQGAYIRADHTAGYSALDGTNSVKSDVSWRKAGSSDQWNSKSMTNGTAVFPADTEAAYEVAIVCSDQVSASRWETKVATVYATVDLLPGGKGVTLGGVATEEGFNCHMPADFLGGISINGVPLETYIQNVISGN